MTDQNPVFSLLEKRLAELEPAYHEYLLTQRALMALRGRTRVASGQRGIGAQTTECVKAFVLTHPRDPLNGVLVRKSDVVDHLCEVFPEMTRGEAHRWGDVALRNSGGRSVERGLWYYNAATVDACKTAEPPSPLPEPA